MKPAAEILDNHLSSLSWDKENPELTAMRLRAIDVINEARKECIIECAERAEADIDTNLPLGEGMGYGYSVEKQSILKLIGELK